MKSGEKNPNKKLYNELRALSCAQLWETEVPRFDRASPEERFERVALVRAVGVVFSETGTAEQKDLVRPWLRKLLQDSSEKIRRYAMAALPKIGAGTGEEAEMLSLLRSTTVEREKKFLGQALQKIGGAATLEEVGGRLVPGDKVLLQTEQKVRANVARSQGPGVVRMDSVLSDVRGVQIHLRCRRGLEDILCGEVEESVRLRGKFKVTDVRPGLVALRPMAPFSLEEVYSLRCFGTLGFILGSVPRTDAADSVEALAGAIASPLSQRLFKAFSEGAIRYRLDFVARGHQRGAVREVVNRAYALCPEILNDSRDAPWTIAVYPSSRGDTVELSPKLTPDPRFFYRQKDVPAASHPPLAACMARLGGLGLKGASEVVWDPFCGSGLELVERALLGGVQELYGTDRSAEAIEIAERNFLAANPPCGMAKFVCSDFRDFANSEGANSMTLIITNPPMGKRVPIANLGRLIEDLFFAAASVLKPGGRLVFANPMQIGPADRSLKLEYWRIVDFSGFDCRLEMYRKV